MENSSTLDPFERKILALLQADSARSTAEIASEIGLSEAPCWRRIQKLKREGYIRKQVCLLDRHKLDLPIQVFVQIKLNAVGRSSLSEFEDAIKCFSEVLECYVLMGQFDFLLKIVSKDISTYERFFFDQLSRVPGIQDANSMVAMSEIKSTTELPI
jgi:Lrp/AsnC family transcriptional regulator